MGESLVLIWLRVFLASGFLLLASRSYIAPWRLAGGTMPFMRR